jgi:hypothetical protein
MLKLGAYVLGILAAPSASVAGGDRYLLVPVDVIALFQAFR